MSSSYGCVFRIVLMQDYREDDTQWPRKNIVGKQELEIRLGNEHISFEVSLPESQRTVGDSWLTCPSDCQNRILERRAGLAGPGWTEGFLLSHSGSQGA